MHNEALSNHFMQHLINCVTLMTFLAGAVNQLSNYLILYQTYNFINSCRACTQFIIHDFAQFESFGLFTFFFFLPYPPHFSNLQTCVFF